MMPGVLLSPGDDRASTSSYCTVSLIPRLLRRQLAYSAPQLLHMYVMSHLLILFAHSKFSEFYIVRQLVPTNNSDLNVESVLVFVRTWYMQSHGGGVLDEQGGDIVADCSQIVTQSQP